jgi:hypothetical protein
MPTGSSCSPSPFFCFLTKFAGGVKVKNQTKEKPKAQSHSLSDDLKRRLEFISKQQKNLDVEIAILEKRKQKYTEGLPKVDAQLEKLNAKKKVARAIFYLLFATAKSEFASLVLPRKSGHRPFTVSFSIPMCFLSGNRATQTFY